MGPPPVMGLVMLEGVFDRLSVLDLLTLIVPRNAPVTGSKPSTGGAYIALGGNALR